MYEANKDFAGQIVYMSTAGGYNTAKPIEKLTQAEMKKLHEAGHPGILLKDKK